MRNGLLFLFNTLSISFLVQKVLKEYNKFTLLGDISGGHMAIVMAADQLNVADCIR
jgi:hypothetical protein